MPAGGDVRGEVGPDVVATRQKRRNQHRRNVVGQGAEHVTRRRAEYVDERGPYPSAEEHADPVGELADHLDAVSLSGAVRYQDRVHATPTGNDSSTVSR